MYTYQASYKDIVPAERIVYGYTMEAGGTLISVSVTTVEFAAAPGGTTLTFTEQGVFLDGGDTPAVREKGTGELLDALGAALGMSRARSGCTGPCRLTASSPGPITRWTGSSAHSAGGRR